MNKIPTQQKIVISIFVVLIVALALYAVVPVLASLYLGPGTKTEGLNSEKTEAASTDIDGEWSVVQGAPPNLTAAGFTFDEVLPNERKSTSGSTQTVTGDLIVEEGTLTAGEVVVDLTNITTDRDVRDVNVRRKLLMTEEFPEATFLVTEPADVSHLPEDGSADIVELTGDLTIKGNTHEVTHVFDAVRDGDRLIVSGDIPIDRNDYGVESPEMIAASIADEGEVNVLLVFEKTAG